MQEGLLSAPKRSCLIGGEHSQGALCGLPPDLHWARMSKPLHVWHGVRRVGSVSHVGCHHP